MRARPFALLLISGVLRANSDGAGIVQAIGPMKTFVKKMSLRNADSKKFLVLTAIGDLSQVGLREANAATIGR